MTNSRAISTFSTESSPETDVRCSIIVPAGDDLSMLNNYLLFLNQAQFPCDYEIVIANDRGLHIDEKLLGGCSLAVKILNLDTQLSRGQLFNKSAVAARGKFLLFVREFIKFDKLVLEEAIRDLDASEDKISVSANGNFLLAESSFYISNEIIMQIIKETDENTPLDQIIGSDSTGCTMDASGPADVGFLFAIYIPRRCMFRCRGEYRQQNENFPQIRGQSSCR